MILIDCAFLKNHFCFASLRWSLTQLSHVQVVRSFVSFSLRLAVACINDFNVWVLFKDFCFAFLRWSSTQLSHVPPVRSLVSFSLRLELLCINDFNVCGLVKNLLRISAFDQNLCAVTYFQYAPLPKFRSALNCFA